MKQKILNTKLTDDQVALFYTGQEGFIIRYKDTFILLDGYLSDYVDKNCWTPEVPWKRLYPAPIKAEELDFIDYVFCSHSHFDHSDPETLSTLAKINKKAKYIVPAPIAETIASYGISATDMIPAEAGQVIALTDSISVTPIPAAHEQLNPDANGRYPELGYRLTLGNVVLFHAGDCCIYDGLEENLGHVDIAMLPINGRDYYRLKRDIVGNMDSREAIELSNHIGAKLLVPMHYDLYAVNRVSAASFMDMLEASGTYLPVHLFQPGERYIFAN